MWLENLKELKKKSGMSSKNIAELTNLPERTVSRIFSGDTEDPRTDTLRRIVSVLGGSLDDIFAESDTVVANTTLQTAQKELEEAINANTMLMAELAVLKDKNCTLEAECDRLRLMLAHKEEILALHNYYMSRK